MKYYKVLLVMLITFLITTIEVYATGGNMTVSSDSVYVGDTFNVSVQVYSAASWNVHVSATGPVSGCTINQADATADAMDTNKTFTASCKATGTGTITLTLSGDVTSASDGNPVYISGTRTVTVNQKTTPTPTPKPSDNRSNNNTLKELSVVGYTLNRVDAHNYTLSVPSDVDSIEIKATAEHAKAKVTGTGKHNLNYGENTIEIIVTAENGAKNTIYLKVTRKEGYFIEDLSNALNGNNSSVDIILKIDTKISASDLEKIKNSQKIVNLNYYDADKLLLYSWIIDGSKLDNIKDFTSGVSFSSKYKKDILKLSNYADGLYFSLDQKDNLPLGAKIKLFVGDKYENDDLVNVYSYTPNHEELDLVSEQIPVKNGYLEYEINDASDYLLTMSTIPKVDDNKSIKEVKEDIQKEDKTKQSIIPVIIGVVILAIVGIVLFVFLENKKKVNKNIFNNQNIQE